MDSSTSGHAGTGEGEREGKGFVRGVFFFLPCPFALLGLDWVAGRGCQAWGMSVDRCQLFCYVLFFFCFLHFFFCFLYLFFLFLFFFFSNVSIARNTRITRNGSRSN